MVICNCKEKNSWCEDCDHREAHAQNKHCIERCAFHHGVMCEPEEVKENNPCPF